MSGKGLESELANVMDGIGWRVISQPEKAPAIDFWCIYPNPETGRQSPGMTVAFQVKSSRQPTPSAVGLKNLKILQQLQVPVFWYCRAPQREQRSREFRQLSYLSPEWLSDAIKRLDGNKTKVRDPKTVSLKNPLCDADARRALHSFIKARYKSFLSCLSEGALAPFLRVQQSAAAWDRHISRTAERLRGLERRIDIEVCLELGKLGRQQGNYPDAEAQFKDAAAQLDSEDDRLRSRYWYERAYSALDQEKYQPARLYAEWSGTDNLRRAIGESVKALSYYLPVLRSQRLTRNYQQNVLGGLDRALKHLEKVRPPKADRWLKKRWVGNILVFLAETHAVNSLLGGKGVDPEAEAVRRMTRARKYWFQTRLTGGIASCLFADALLARLRNDRRGFDLASKYFKGTAEGDFTSLQEQFLKKLRQNWTQPIK